MKYSIYRLVFAATLAAVTLICLPSAHADAISGLFNTGVTTDNSTLATPGDADQHYTLTDSPYGPITAYVSSSYPYNPPATNSQYIGADPNLSAGFSTGLYTYQTTFDLTGLDSATASISGNVFADDDVYLYLNGQDTGIVFYSAFFDYSPFTINTGFVEGTNTLEFRVDNAGGGATGLSVSQLSGTANAVSSAVPEAGTIALVLPALGLLGAVAIRRRKSTAV